MRRGYFVIFIASFLLSLIFVCLDRDGREVKADARTYYTIAENIVRGNGFSDETILPYSPTMSREPVYPLFLAFWMYFFKSSVFYIQIAQSLIYALTCVIIFKTFSMLIDTKKSFVISMIAAMFPTLPSYTPYLQTEVLFTFLLAASLLGLICSFKYNSLKWFFYSGLMIGLAALCRAILMFFFIFVIMAVLLHYFRIHRKIFSLRAVKASFVLLLGYFLIVTPWVLRNYDIFGKPSITLRAYGTMYTRAAKVNLSGREFNMYAAYCFSEYLASRLYPGYNFSSTSEGYFYQPAANKNKEHRALGLTQKEADGMFKEETLSLVRSHPVKFVFMGFFEIIKFNSFSQILLLNLKDLENAIPDKYILPAVRGLLKFLGFFIVTAAFIGMFSTYRSRHNLLILFCVIMYFNILHLFLDSIGRYAVPIIPYYIFFFTLQIYRWTGRLS